MSYPLIQLKRGDTAPPARAVLTEVTGDPTTDLAGATVFFHMADDSGTVKVSGQATVVDVPSGRVEYRWDLADTNQTGRFFAEWEIHGSAGERRTFPVRGFQRVTIGDDLA